MPMHASQHGQAHCGGYLSPVTAAPPALQPQLVANIPSNWGARAAGIQVSSVPPADAVSIHHGAGSWKKIR